MATLPDIAEYIYCQFKELNNTRIIKMFGEYGIYCQEKMIALICDDQLFIKPTAAGKDYLSSAGLDPESICHPPYPGAKDWFLIPEDEFADALWLAELVRITLPEVPLPKKKSPKKKAKAQDAGT